MWAMHTKTPLVRGHEKVPTGGQVEVPAGGQIEVPTPCSSCRSGAAGPGGDGDGANHSPSPPGSSIEVCEGTHGHHLCLSTVGSYRAAAELCGTTHKTVKTGRGEVRSRRGVAAAAGRAGPQLRCGGRAGRRTGGEVCRPDLGQAVVADRSGGRLRGFGAELPPPGRRRESVVAQRTSSGSPTGGVVTG